MAVTLVVVTAVAMVVFLALSAYAPQMRTETGGRPNVLSKSAIGYAGLKILLEETGTVVGINRSRTPDEDLPAKTLLILTPDGLSSQQSLTKLAGAAPVLIVLPKWPAVPDYLHSGWVRKFVAYEPGGVAEMLKGLDDTTSVEHPFDPAPDAKDKTKSKTKKITAATVRLAGTPAFGTSPFPPVLSIDAFQTIAGKKWEPLLTDGHGHNVLVRLKGTETYVLSDPDLVNTAALKNEAVAAGALDLIARIAPGAHFVEFDVTLAGFDNPPSLLHSVFSAPFLATTIGALLVAILMVFRALNRFGTPRAEARAFAFGKRSLADNTASLIRVMGRGPGMAPRYAAAVRRQAAKTLRGGRAEDVRWLDGVEQAGHITPTYAELLAEAEHVATVTDMMRLAAKLHDWKSRIIHERR